MLQEDAALGNRMEEDFPPDEVTIGIRIHQNQELQHHITLSAIIDSFMETIAGLDGYRLLLKSNDLKVKRRILLCSWLYVIGFLEQEFPATVKFIPGHLNENQTI